MNHKSLSLGFRKSPLRSPAGSPSSAGPPELTKIRITWRRAQSHCRMGTKLGGWMAISPKEIWKEKLGKSNQSPKKLYENPIKGIWKIYIVCVLTVFLGGLPKTYDQRRRVLWASTFSVHQKCPPLKHDLYIRIQKPVCNKSRYITKNHLHAFTKNKLVIQKPSFTYEYSLVIKGGLRGFFWEIPQCCGFSTTFFQTSEANHPEDMGMGFSNILPFVWFLFVDISMLFSRMTLYICNIKVNYMLMD